MAIFLAQGSGFRLTYWAGCSANWCDNCIFGCSHANWSDPTHSSQYGHLGLDVGCGNIPVLASAAGNSGSSNGVPYDNHLHFEILLLKTGLGSSLTNTGILYNNEQIRWLRYPSETEGLLVTNPSTTNYTSSTTCNFSSSK